PVVILTPLTIQVIVAGSMGVMPIVTTTSVPWPMGSTAGSGDSAKAATSGAATPTPTIPVTLQISGSSVSAVNRNEPCPLTVTIGSGHCEQLSERLLPPLNTSQVISVSSGCPVVATTVPPSQATSA